MKLTLVFGALTLGLLVFTAPGSAIAAASDFEFTLVETSIKEGDGAIISVRLIDKRTGNSVPDAIIFTTRLDMEPEGMATMLTPVEALPSTEPGVYRFKADLTMQGGWRFSIAAKVQGEIDTVQMQSNFEAVK
ncbi:MAG: FixH family protein [Salaquimonas sp.]